MPPIVDRGHSQVRRVARWRNENTLTLVERILEGRTLAIHTLVRTLAGHTWVGS